jgi:transcriptional regulator with XRE-family HTH domain
MPNALATLIRERRQDLGLTQEQLAERIGGGARQSEVSRLEQGKVSLPRRLRMEQIARALELPLGEVLLRSGWAGAESIDRLTERDRDAATGHDDEELQQNIGELQDLNADLRATVDKLQGSNDRMRDRSIEKAIELRLAEAIVEQMRAILNVLPDAVVVVNSSGFVVVENTAYAMFATRHTDTPVMLDATGTPISENDLPLERAARGGQFTMTFAIDEEGTRHTYVADGHQVSTVQGGLVGVVTIRPQDLAVT